MLKALHVEEGSYEWTGCTKRVDYTRGHSYFVYKELIGKIRILVYSGTADMAVPTTGKAVAAIIEMRKRRYNKI